MQKKKVLFVATVVKTHMMQFHIPYLKMFREMGWETAVASKNDYENPVDCQIPYCDTYYDIPFARLPWKWSNIQSYKMLKRIIDEGNYDIIHCHTPMGSVVARWAPVAAVYSSKARPISGCFASCSRLPTMRSRVPGAKIST